MPRRVGHQHRIGVVVQVFTHAGQVVQHLNAETLQMRGRPNARTHEEGGRLESACTQNNFAPRGQGLRLATLQGVHLPRHAIDQANPVHGHAGHDVQIGTRAIRCEVGLGCAETLARALGDLVQAHTFLCGAIEVGGVRQARLHARLDKALGKRIGALQVGHIQRAVLAMPFVVDAFVVLGLEEIGQHVGPCPARATPVRPRVVVDLLTPDIGHCIG